MGVITENFPLLASQQGMWDGTYVHLDPDHREIDRHQSRLVCRLFDGPDGEARLAQTNIYTWADGTTEIRYFDGVFRQDRLWISNELIDGWTGEISLDPTRRTMMVGWVRQGAPDFRFYELITVSEDGRQKNRTWHWYRNGALFQRTLINEVKSSDNWQDVDHPDLYKTRARGMNPVGNDSR
jgi:hypothetical protein